MLLTLPKNDVDKQKVLQKIAEKFGKDRIYTEEEVNALIKSFDVEDHVLFRRELVNFNYLGRDPYKGTYWLKKSKLSEEELAKISANQAKMKDGGVY